MAGRPLEAVTVDRMTVRDVGEKHKSLLLQELEMDRVVLRESRLSDENCVAACNGQERRGHFPMQYKVVSVRIRILPALIAGLA